MPVYEYTCKRCGARFERLLVAAERDAKQQCPECRKTASERRMSGFATGRSAGPSCAPNSGG